MNSDVALSIRQFTSAWRVMGASSPGYAATSGEGLECVFSGLPVAFFNIAIPTGGDLSADALQAHARDASAKAASHEVPWLFIVTHENLAKGTDAAAALDECGLAPMMPLTGMLATRVAPASRVPDALELRVPDDAAGCAAVVDVNAEAYGMSLEAARGAIGSRAFWQNHVLVLGLAGGHPVSSSAVMMVDGYRYVALVATTPGQQRRGYAEAVMRHALDVSARTHGEQPTFLHATDAGRPVYERMGYVPVATHTLFIEKRFLVDH